MVMKKNEMLIEGSMNGEGDDEEEEDEADEYSDDDDVSWKVLDF